MHKATHHIGVLMIVGVLALGLLGAAYTMWFENLTLTANVTTGNLDVAWSNEGATPIISLDGGQTWIHKGDLNPNGSLVIPDEKFIQNCALTIVPGTNGVPDSLTVTTQNLYPWAGCDMGLDIHNAGNVPVHFTKAGVTGYSVTGNIVAATAYSDILPTTPDEGNTCYELLDPVWNGPQNETGDTTPLHAYTNGAITGPLQLHTGEHLTCHFIFYPIQAITEGSVQTGTLLLKAHQWNEQP